MGTVQEYHPYKRVLGHRDASKQETYLEKMKRLDVMIAFFASGKSQQVVGRPAKELYEQFLEGQALLRTKATDGEHIHFVTSSIEQVVFYPAGVKFA